MIGMVADKPRMWALGGAGALLIFIILLIFLAITNSDSVIHPTGDQNLYSLHSDQCEQPRSGWVFEVENTLSNFGYALAGLLILLRVTSWAGHLLGVSLVLLSITSGLYHATLTPTTQLLDVVWVYAALLSLSVYASYVHVQAERPFQLSRWFWICCGAAWAILALIVLVLFQMAGLAALICLTLFVVVVEALCFLSRRVLSELTWVVAPVLFVAVPLFGFMIKQSFRWDSDAVFAILAALLIFQLAFLIATAKSLDSILVGWELTGIGVVFALGLFFRLGDGYTKHITGEMEFVQRKLLCHPDALVQPHALWHLLGALALLLSYDLMVQFSRANAGEAADRTVMLPDRSVLISDRKP
jgi:hypothetical protein